MSLSKKTAPVKTDPEPSPLVAKYGNYIAGRESDGRLINQRPDFGAGTQGTYKDIFTAAASKYDLRPELLFASTTEEGLRDMINRKEWSGRADFPIAGFEHFGLDFFSADFPTLVQRGLLPEDFKNNFTKKMAVKKGEAGESVVPSADFKTLEDAITAKAAVVANRRIRVDEEAKKQGIQLSPAAREFFTLVDYNSTAKTLPMIMSDYSKAGYLENDAFLKERPKVGKNGVKLSEKSYADVYDHAMRRIVPAQAWSEQFSAPSQQQPQQTTAKASGAAQLPNKFLAPINGKQVEVQKSSDGRYTYVNDDGDIVEYKR